MKSIKSFFPILALIVLLAPRAHAQFGSGIVYDPAQSVHALQQIEQEAQELNNWSQHLLKEAQIYTTAEETRTQIVTMYNLAYQMPQNLAARYKSDFAQWSNISAPNTYGNTSAWMNVLNSGGASSASQAYSNAVIQPRSYPPISLSAQDVATQATIQNQYASSELAQGTTTSTLATLGTIRSNSQVFQQKLANLDSDTYSTDPAQQTQNALLGKINSATVLQVHSQQDANQILAAATAQQALDAKEKLDERNRLLNQAIYFEQNFATTMQNVTGGVSDSVHAISLSPTGR